MAKKIFFILLILNAAIYAQEMVPVKAQAVLIKKIYKYTENIQELYVTVIYSDKDKTLKDNLVSELKSLGVKVDALNERMITKADGSILYLTAHLSESALQKAKTVKKLVISANKEHSVAGYSSLSVVLMNHKPKILVNLKALETAGIKVSGSLFRVAQKVN